MSPRSLLVAGLLGAVVLVLGGVLVGRLSPAQGSDGTVEPVVINPSAVSETVDPTPTPSPTPSPTPTTATPTQPEPSQVKPSPRRVDDDDDDDDDDLDDRDDPDDDD